ncbi:MAG: ArgE/DapE family deacylase [Candidatus Methanofastidiosia archaeon]|jgi:succinyl-diaminopimelate desuccinylase
MNISVLVIALRNLEYFNGFSCITNLKSFILSLIKSIMEYKDEIIKFTKDLISIPTINPPGKNYAQCVQVIEEKCKKLGIETRIYECDGLPSIVGGNGKGILHFHGHYDVVDAQTSQFVPYSKEGTLYGRGSSDMKGGIAAMLYAIHKLDCDDITFSITPDEETGGTHGVLCLLEKSVIDPKAVLMPEVSSNRVWYGCRGAFAVKIIVKGESAHSVYQNLGKNAFEDMLDVAHQFREIDPGEGTLLLGGAVKGGTQFNMVPEVCSFSLDWRFPPDQSLAKIKNDVFTCINRMREKGIHIETEILVETNGFSTSKEEKICKITQKAVQKIRGLPHFEVCPGFLDIRHFAHKGIPAVAYGPGLLEVAHGPEEYIQITDLLDAFSVYVLIGRKFINNCSK